MVFKMSKSLGNYIGIDEEPKEMYGKGNVHSRRIDDALLHARYRHANRRARGHGKTS